MGPPQVSQGKHKQSLSTFEHFNLTSVSKTQPEQFNPGKVVGLGPQWTTSMPLCHCSCYPLSQPRAICPWELAAGGSWADMKTSVQFSCPLPREMWLQQVIPLFRLVTQRREILTLGCRKACKKKKPVSNFLQMALAAWHGWMSGFPWETKCVCTVHLLSLIPKYSWGKREDFSLSQWMVLESVSLISWGGLDGH